MDRGDWWAIVHRSQRAGHDWTDLACMHARILKRKKKMIWITINE